MFSRTLWLISNTCGHYFVCWKYFGLFALLDSRKKYELPLMSEREAGKSGRKQVSRPQVENWTEKDSTHLFRSICWFSLNQNTFLASYDSKMIYQIASVTEHMMKQRNTKLCCCSQSSNMLCVALPMILSSSRTSLLVHWLVLESDSPVLSIHVGVAYDGQGDTHCFLKDCQTDLQSPQVCAYHYLHFYWLQNTGNQNPQQRLKQVSICRRKDPAITQTHCTFACLLKCFI